jgi:predicted nuclease of predicted toxin-antitoxin system
LSLFELPLLADENIHPEVVRNLVEREANVVSAGQLGLAGAGDAAILARAHAERRVVLTHDRDFGTLAIRAGEPFFGIVYLRPGDISPGRVLAMLDAIHAAKAELSPPFLVVAHRRKKTVRIRVRRFTR